MTAPMEPADSATLSSSSETILLLAQSPETRVFLRDALSGSGYQVLESGDYPEAQKVLDQVPHSVDLILSCHQSDQAPSAAQAARLSRNGIPVIDIAVSPDCADQLPVAEITLRIDLALEAASPSRSVLLVSEDRPEREMVAELLETAGYRVRQSSNGTDAFRMLRENPPDILLTEIVLPERDGLELIQEIRKQRMKTTPIAMSGTARADGYLSVARLLGAQFLLIKPLSANRLMQVLREARRQQDAENLGASGTSLDTPGQPKTRSRPSNE